MGVVAAEAVLFIVLTAIEGPDALGLGAYLAVVTIMLLPSRQAVIAVGLCVLGALAIPRAVPGWHPNDTAAGQVMLASAAMFGVMQLVNRTVQLAQARAELAELAVAQERARFSRDLHDLPGHSLTVLAIKAELAGRLIPTDPQAAGREIGEVELLARDALADVRAAVSGYRDGSLAGELVSARTALDAAGIEAELPGAVDGVPAERRSSPGRCGRG